MIGTEFQATRFASVPLQQSGCFSMRATMLLSLSATLALAGCTMTGGAGLGALPAIEFYAPGEIVVSTSASGRLGSREGCLLFVQQAGSLAAQFPAGTRYSMGGDVQFPGGDRIPLDRQVDLVFEARPGERSTAAGCAGPAAIQVIGRKA